MLHHEQGAGDNRQKSRDPGRDGKPDHEVQAEDQEKEGKEEMSHGDRLPPAAGRSHGV